MATTPAKKAPAKKAPAKAAPKPAAEPPVEEPKPQPEQASEPVAEPESEPQPEPASDDIDPLAAPLDPPTVEAPPLPPIEIGASVNAQAVRRLLAVSVDGLELFDHQTQGPIDPDTLFDHPNPHASYVVSTRRVCERVFMGPHNHQTEHLLLPKGAHLSLGEATVLVGRIREANAAAGVTFDTPADTED